METKDTQQVEGLEEIAERVALSVFNETDQCDFSFAQALLSDPAILAHMPGYAALREENAAIQGSVKRARELIGDARFKTHRYRAEDIDGTLCAANAILSLTTTTGLDLYVGEAVREKDKRIADLESQLAALQGGEVESAGTVGAAIAKEIDTTIYPTNGRYSFSCEIEVASGKPVAAGKGQLTFGSTPTPFIAQPAIAGKVPDAEAIRALMDKHLDADCHKQDSPAWICGHDKFIEALQAVIAGPRKALNFDAIEKLARDYQLDYNKLATAMSDYATEQHWPVEHDQPLQFNGPPGYALVPIVPTPSMHGAGDGVSGKCWMGGKVWAAMLAASPSAPIAEQAKEVERRYTALRDAIIADETDCPVVGFANHVCAWSDFDTPEKFDAALDEAIDAKLAKASAESGD